MSYLESQATNLQYYQSNRNNQANFDPSSVNFNESAENKTNASCDSSILDECPNAVSNSARQMDLFCLNYEKCFTSTIEYSENNLNYPYENPYAINTNQLYNSSDQMEFNQMHLELNGPQMQSGK